MDRSLILCLLVLAIIIGCVLFVKDQSEHFGDVPGWVETPLPTSPEVELIQGEPDMHVVNEVDGSEMIVDGDIALSPGFGIGEGTVGFGRYGSSFIM